MSNPNPATRTDDISDSKKQPSFGIMISCFSGDLPMLRGCLASVRLMLPRLPICLVTHGTFDVSEFVAVYGVSILSETDVDPVCAR